MGFLWSSRWLCSRWGLPHQGGNALAEVNQCRAHRDPQVSFNSERPSWQVSWSPAAQHERQKAASPQNNPSLPYRNELWATADKNPNFSCFVWPIMTRVPYDFKSRCTPPPGIFLQTSEWIYLMKNEELRADACTEVIKEEWSLPNLAVSKSIWQQ